MTLLRKLRRQACISLDDLAFRSGFNADYISRIEAGAVVKPPSAVLDHLAEIIGWEGDSFALIGEVHGGMMRLKKLRRQKSMTQRGLAKLAGCSVETVNRYETGWHTQGGKALADIAKALGWEGDPRELLDEVDE